MIEQFFCSTVLLDNRNKVRYATDRVRAPKSGDIVIGYIFESDGKYRKYWMKFTMDNLARFICSNDKDKLVCDNNDYAFLNTIGTYIDLCFLHEDFRKNIISTLDPYQHMKGKNISFDSLK